MAKVLLPPGCGGFADGNKHYLAERGVGSYVNVTDEQVLKKLNSQDYAQAGLVTGQQKEFINDARKQGRWCRTCNRLWHAWAKTCSKCGGETIPEADMERPSRTGQYMP